LFGCAATEPQGSDGSGRGNHATPTAMPGAINTAPMAGAGALNVDNATTDPASWAADPTMPVEPVCMPGMRCHDETDPDAENCGYQELMTEVEVITHPGNVLLVFDTSFSMTENWNGMGARWEQAGPAIVQALMPLQDLLTVGTVFFPRSDPNAPAVCIDPTGIACIFVPGLVIPSGACGVTPITSSDQINFQPGPAFLQTFGANPMAPIYTPVPGGLTPLKEGLMQAQAALASSMLPGITSVVIVTDGDPNCEWDQAVAQQIVDGWLTQGIRTYVVGLPGTSGQGDAILTDLATRGGTMRYITPANPDELASELRNIATETVMMGFNSCEIALTPPAEVPDKLHMVVTAEGMDQLVPRDFSADGSWTVTADGSMATLQGTLCDDAMAGRFTNIKFEFGCADPPPIPPLPVVK
jgi:hypothetical protein